jgi:hypothetical protein
MNPIYSTIVLEAHRISSNFKILVYSFGGGLNDVFSTLSYYTDYFHKNNLNLENLHFTSNYGDLNQYFNFKYIKYIPIPSLNEYNFISNLSVGTYTDLNIKNGLHISNLVSLKDDLKNNIKVYSNDHIAVHFRLRDLETNRRIIGNPELESYVNGFNKIYDKNEKYLVFSDSSIINSYLKYDNMTFLTPDININEDKHAKYEIRKELLYKTISDLYIMSNCKLVYRTKGQFTNLTHIFNKNLNIKSLQF